MKFFKQINQQLDIAMCPFIAKEVLCHFCKSIQASFSTSVIDKRKFSTLINFRIWGPSKTLVSNFVQGFDYLLNQTKSDVQWRKYKFHPINLLDINNIALPNFHFFLCRLLFFHPMQITSIAVLMDILYIQTADLAGSPGTIIVSWGSWLFLNHHIWPIFDHCI